MGGHAAADGGISILTHPANLKNQPWWPSVEPLYRAGATADQLAAIFKCSPESIKRHMRAAGIHKGNGRPSKVAVLALQKDPVNKLNLYVVLVEFTDPWPTRERNMTLHLATPGWLAEVYRMLEHVPADVRVSAIFRKGEIVR